MKGSGRGRAHAAAEELREKIGRFSGRPRFNHEFEEAFRFFFGEEVESLQDSLDEGDFDRFLEWFVHDYRLANGHRLIEMFDLEHSVDLSRHARKMLRQWQNAHLTVLELQEASSDGCALVDLLRGRRIEVATLPFDDEPPPWSVIVGRPLPVGDGWELSSAATVLSAAMKEPLLALVRGEYRRYRRACPTGSVERFLREEGYVFNDLLAEVDAGIDDGDAAQSDAADRLYRIVRCRAVYQAPDAKRIAERLLAYPDIEKGDEDRLQWLDERGRALAEIEIAGGRLQLLCWSLKRLERVKALLDERVKGLALHLLDAYDEGGGAYGPWNGAEGLRPPAMEEWADAFDEYVERWINAPLRSGGGFAPKQLLKKPLGRQRLIAVLKEQERLEASRRRGLWRFASELRRALGLEGESEWIAPLGAKPVGWNNQEEEDVVACIERHFAERGLSAEHVDAATWMWWDYCSRAHPRIRKVEAWAAAVHASISRVERWDLRHADVAAQYGVSTSSVSENAHKIDQTLDLRSFDDRYSVEYPVEGGISRFVDAAQNGVFVPAGSGSAYVRGMARLRDEVRKFAAKHDGLRDRAQALFEAHVTCSKREPLWRDGFLDWFHFDWPVPVMGGRTLVQEASRASDVAEADRRLLEAWADCHPSFYVVEELTAADGASGFEGPRLALKDLEDGSVRQVDWLRATEPIRPHDVVFARLAPVGQMTVSLGPVVALPQRFQELVKRALEEERALVNRWNGRYVSWNEFRARYAERLYGIACHVLQQFGQS